jgi:hypothetical protein
MVNKGTWFENVRRKVSTFLKVRMIPIKLLYGTYRTEAAEVRAV